MVWYYAEGNSQIGPKSDVEFRQLVSAGVIRSDTLVWREGMPGWKPYAEVDPALVFAGSSDAAPQGRAFVREEGDFDAPMTVCSACGRVFSSEDVIEFAGKYVCAECKPVFVQQLKESGRVPGTMNYAGFWIRFVARCIDGIILFVANLIISVIATSIGSATGEAGMAVMQILAVVANYAVSIAYVTYFLGSRGATPGKMVLGLRVVMEDGRSISYWRAFARFWADLLSALVLCIGYIIAAFDSEKRALHDHLCSTRVIRL